MNVDLRNIAPLEPTIERLFEKRTRIQKEMDTIAPYVASLEKKLQNEGFVKNAAPEVDGPRRGWWLGFLLVYMVARVKSVFRFSWEA